MSIRTTYFIHSSVDWDLGCVYVLAIVNNAAMNTGLHVFFWIMIFSRYTPRIGITEWYGSSIFRFLRNLHTVLQSGYTNFPSQQCRFPFSSHPLLVLIDFWMMAILTSVRWYLIVVLICIFLIINGAEHLFMSFFGYVYVSLEICLFKFFTCFLLGCFFWYWIAWAVCVLVWPKSLLGLEKPERTFWLAQLFWRLILLVALFANIFSHSEDHLFILFMASFDMEKLLSLKFCF